MAAAALRRPDAPTGLVSAVGFSFYESDDVRATSVKQVKHGVLFDASNNPLHDGLYDPAMGPVDRKQGLCVTCGLSYSNCPGHCGHIALPVPVYHPLGFPTARKLLQSTCQFCYRLRVPEHRTAAIAARLELLRDGHMQEAGDLASDAHAGTAGDRRAAAAIGVDGDERKDNSAVCANAQPAKSIPRWSANSLELAARASDELFAGVQTKLQCPNCGAHNPKMSLRGPFKLFVHPLKDKQVLANQTRGCALRSALAEERARQGPDIEPDAALPPAPPAADSDSDEAEEDAGGVQTSDDDDGGGSGDDGEGEEGEASNDGSRLMTAEEARAILRRLWRREHRVLDNLFGCLQLRAGDARPDGAVARYWSRGPDAYFITYFLVPPNRFRPPSMLGDQVFEHPLNSAYVRILSAAEKVEGAGTDVATEAGMPAGLGRYANAIAELQDGVASLMDATTARNKGPDTIPGVRQLLEKKEGVFRKNMMGKRVNFAARSVISPDPYLAPDEIGVPPPIARGLLYPEPVTPHNIDILRQAVINGRSGALPGASAVEGADGRVVDLSRLDASARKALAKLLASGTAGGGDAGVGTRPKVVYRTLMDGDILLVNRQPSLHRPSIMAHRARLLSGERTIRMHYSNCASYNADFDGDEMNLHLPQDTIARAEAYHVASADLQYHLPTDGGPKRGLIQDHVIALVKLTSRGTAHLTRGEVAQMLYFAIDGGTTADRVARAKSRGATEGGGMTISDLTKTKQWSSAPRTKIPMRRIGAGDAMRNVAIPAPALVAKAADGQTWIARWTGKQVIEALLAHVVKHHAPADGDGDNGGGRPSRMPTFSHGCKVKHEAWPGGAISDGVGDGQLAVVDGTLLYGVLDKNTFGSGGLIQHLHEYFSPYAAGTMLGCLSRLGTYLLANRYGFTCGMSDLWLNGKAEALRAEALEKADEACQTAHAGFVRASQKDPEALRKLVAKRLVARPELGAALDTKASSSLGGVTSEAMKCGTISGVSSEGAYIDPLYASNGMSQMTQTGAKGGTVNQLQISVCLGQQELEGHRVPRNMYGKTLPCFKPYEISAASGGYIADRFLTGLDPRAYYYHCMAGRDGLVDTTVKTSRSGYLQRCLIKSLEGLRIRYDSTVREDVDNNIVQFQYGDDGLDVSRVGIRTFHPAGVYANRALAARVCGMKPEELLTDARAEVAKAEDGGKKRKKERESLTSDDGTAAVHASSRADADATLDAADGGVPNLPLSARLPASTPGVTSESHRSCVRKFVASNPELFATAEEAAKAVRKARKKAKKELGKGDDDAKGISLSNVKPTADGFSRLCEKLFSLAAADPGEAVGVIAAQSIGEPSTQMTLNTFHFAGRGEANVTLGVPRLRELLMTASSTIKTPVLTIPMRRDVHCEAVGGTGAPRLRPGRGVDDTSSRNLAELLASRLRRVCVAEVLKELRVAERVGEESPIDSRRVRTFDVTLVVHSVKDLRMNGIFDIARSNIEGGIGVHFAQHFRRIINLEARKLKMEFRNPTAFDPSAGAGSDDGADAKAPTPSPPDDEDEAAEGDDGAAPSTSKPKRVRFSDDDKDLATRMEDDEDGAEEATRGRGGRGEFASYDDGDRDDDTMDAIAQNLEDADAGDAEDVVENFAAGGLRVRHEFNGDARESKHVVTVLLPTGGRKMLLLELAELAATRALVRSPAGDLQVQTNLGRSYVVENPRQRGSFMLQVDGNDFVHAVNRHDDIVDVTEVRCNDVAAVLRTYGVEAARRTVVEEIGAVFDVYGIKVDKRHLSLIGDSMTHSGGYRGFSRMGMAPNASPLLKMSFESAGKFLTEAAVHGSTDRLDGPSARIVLGKVVEVGTGGCQLVQNCAVPLR